MTSSDQPREGSLDAPVRHPLAWREPDFTDPGALDAETRRVFDICHGCRRCFNLCDTFPRLFDLIDNSETGELDSVASAGFGPVVDACTLCDMCFMTKCPYVPPHEFALDFPHLMLRHRAAEAAAGKTGLADRELAKTDRNGKLGSAIAPLANWATGTGNRLARKGLEWTAGIDHRAPLPPYAKPTMEKRWAKDAAPVDRAAPAAGRRAVIYATCHMNYSDPDLGLLCQRLLAANGVETELVYPECCGMPQLEQGALARVADKAVAVAAAMRPWIDQGYQVIALVPSCALMLKMEWPLLVPEGVPGHEDVVALSAATRDVSQVLVDIAKTEGLATQLGPIDGPHGGHVSLHMACHARAQNMGRKAEELLALIPGLTLDVIERCSGHGGAWGVKKGNFDTAMKVGRPVVRAAAKTPSAYVVSECPLAAQHIHHGLAEQAAAEKTKTSHDRDLRHPLEIFARACGLGA
ncbi:MAG: heterodisulfide reductase-related iron-sulfur binding cluster [Alphaproteobacteria bacterium]|nr:heterodisulfide reductase-related iron-sulfur binding cluster [Alphaproteobacteria bacterium]